MSAQDREADGDLIVGSLEAIARSQELLARPGQSTWIAPKTVP